MKEVSATSATAHRLTEATGKGQQPFVGKQIWLSQAEFIQLKWDANYWKAQHERSCAREAALKQELAYKEAKIRDLKQRLFGKKSEKNAAGQDQVVPDSKAVKRPRGQPTGSPGHGRTERPYLGVEEEVRDLADDARCCVQCGLPYDPFPGTEDSEIFEIEVRAYKRHIKRRRYQKGCSCPHSGDYPGIITAAIAPKVIPKSSYGISVWEHILLGKFLYAQPLNRLLQDMSGLGLSIASGTLTGGLKKLAPLFEPIYQAWYLQQMREDLFHNDESRWEVYEAVEGKAGHRWYLWVTRSPSVIYYQMAPRRSADVPIAHFDALETEQVTVVCDRYSAYKKLARINSAINLAYCWAHVRRDFLQVARGFPELKAWGLDWVEAIGRLYHLNQQRLDVWQPDIPLAQQSPVFQQAHTSLQSHLAQMKGQCDAGLQAGQEDHSRDLAGGHEKAAQPQPVHPAQNNVLCSLQNHWQGLIRFEDHPQVPLDNNPAERAIRNPVTGRKNYYGSGSIWSAHLAAMMFSLFQTLGLWQLNPRHWLRSYLTACAEHGGQPPDNVKAFVPWEMDATRREQLSRPPNTAIDTA